MEEQRRVQESETVRSAAAGESPAPPNPSVTAGGPSGTIDMLPSRAGVTNGLLVGVGASSDSQPGGNDMDVGRLTEDEQIALAIQMSMTQTESNRRERCVRV
jgi:hypothetical protein